VVFHGKQGGQGACQFRHHNLVTQAPRGGIVRSMGRCTEARVSLRNRETMGNEIRCVVTGVSLQWNSDYGLPAGPGPEVLYANSTRIRGGGGRICRRRICLRVRDAIRHGQPTSLSILSVGACPACRLTRDGEKIAVARVSGCGRSRRCNGRSCRRLERYLAACGVRVSRTVQCSVKGGER
jgi:hypothetical protein